MDENVTTQEECEHSPNDVLSDNFLVNLLSRNSTAVSDDFEDKVLKSVCNKASKEGVAEDSLVEKDKTRVECEMILEEGESNSILISNLVTSDKLEITTGEKNALVSEAEIYKSAGDILSENMNTELEILSVQEKVENETHAKSVNDIFLESSTIKNSNCVSTATEYEIAKSGEENMKYSVDVVGSCIEKENSKINCEMPVQANSMLTSHPVDSLSLKSVVEIKEVSIQEVPKSNTEKEQSIESMPHTFSQNKYRCESDIWTDDDDSSTSDSSSSSSDSDFFQDMCEKPKPKKSAFVKTKGELSLDDLPPIEDLAISVNESEMTAFGKIHAIVEKLVVIRSMKGMKALDEDSVLFLSHLQPLGRVFEVFGQVTEPFYSVRFNSVSQISEKGVKVGDEVFFAPEKSDITTYVFVEQLQNQKGSDASWKHNNEPPEQFLDYSDDEQEKTAKRERRNKIRNQRFTNNPDAPAKRPFLAEDSSSYIPPPKPVPRWNHSYNVSYRVSRPNPFQSHMPPPSPSPSVCSLMSPVRVQNSFQPSPNQPQRLAQPQNIFSNQPQRLAQPQNIFYRSSPQIFVSPYQQPHHVFGQVAVLNHLSPALHGPPPLPSPVLNSVPALIPASHFPAPQNYFQQAFTRSPASPVTHNQCMTPDPWLPNRSLNSGNVPPSHPLTVQIPNMGSPSLPLHHQFPGERGPVHQFVNIQNGNFNEPYVNNRNYPPVNMPPSYYHS